MGAAKGREWRVQGGPGAGRAAAEAGGGAGRDATSSRRGGSVQMRSRAEHRVSSTESAALSQRGSYEGSSHDSRVLRME